MKESLNQISSEFLFSKLPIGLITVGEDTRLLDANDFFLKYFNENDKDVSGKMFGNVFHCSYAEEENGICGTLDRCEVCDLRQSFQAVLDQGITIEDVALSHNFNLNGRTTTKWFTINASRVEQNGRKLAIVAFTDITHIKEVERELILLGITDELTGLFNRRFILNRLRVSLDEGLIGDYPISVAMLDIDHFKNVNDTHGHSIGDEILHLLASILKKYTRYTDYICRYGGEEFIVIFNGTTGEIAQNILMRINDIFKHTSAQLIGHEVTFSAGLYSVKYDDPAIEIDEIIEKVDKLLYTAKENGRNRIEL